MTQLFLHLGPVNQWPLILKSDVLWTLRLLHSFVAIFRPKNSHYRGEYHCTVWLICIRHHYHIQITAYFLVWSNSMQPYIDPSPNGKCSLLTLPLRATWLCPSLTKCNEEKRLWRSGWGGGTKPRRRPARGWGRTLPHGWTSILL